MMRTRIFLFCLSTVLAAGCFGQSPPTRGAVAVIDGQPILNDELSSFAEGQLRQFRSQEYEARRKALDDLINQRLVEAKAKVKGLSAEEFLRQEVDDKLSAPGGAELEAFYLGQRNLASVPFEQVRDQLLPAFKQRRAEYARQVFIRRLRQAASVTVMLSPPKVQVSYDPARVLGNPDAPVTIVEFTDFQCPYCRNATATLKELMNKYKDQVRLAFRDFPLQQIHPRAERAAEAGRCATEQGKFWAYHDLLFASPEKLTDEDFDERARTLGLDVKQFGTCLRTGKYKAQVEEDLKGGTQAGVSGTPGFFINGVFLNGAQPLANFERVIDAELVSLKVQGHQSDPLKQ